MTDKKVGIGVWTDKDKELMKDVSFDIVDLINSKLKDTLMIANVLSIVTKSFSELACIEKILHADKDGKIIKDRVGWVLKIIEGMQKSDVNLILFKDYPDVWMQYYMGLFFERPTYIIALRMYEKKVERLLKNPLVKRVEYISKWDGDSINDALKLINDDIEKEKKSGTRT